MLGPFTYADVAIIVLVLIAIIVGLVKGFMSQIFSFLGGFASLIVAALFCVKVTEKIDTLGWFAWLYEKAGATLGHYAAIALSFVCIAFVVTIVVLILKNLMKKLTELPVIKGIDKFLGMILSIGILYFVVMALFALVTLIPTGFIASLDEILEAQLNGGLIAKYMYGANNWFGNWLLSIIKLPDLFGGAKEPAAALLTFFAIA